MNRDKNMRYAPNWKTDLETYKRIYLDMKSALHFSPGAKIGEQDLRHVLKIIASASKGKNIAEIQELTKKTKYSQRELDSIIKRLKMLGEIFDPYFTTKKEGRYLKTI